MASIVWPSGYRQDGPHVSGMHRWVVHTPHERCMEQSLLAGCIHVSSLDPTSGQWKRNTRAQPAEMQAMRITTALNS
jgi:hypothetical protein